MSSSGENSGPIAGTAQAIAEISKAIPVYQDAIQPAAKEVGKGLQLIAKAVNAALAPVEGLIWGVEKIKEFVHERVAKKLVNVPIEDVQPPKQHIAVPAIEALRYTGSDSELSDLFANLLANSMDRSTAIFAHPAFVDMIKNMSSDEAKIMRIFVDNQDSFALINIKLIFPDGGFRVAFRHISLIGIKAQCDHTILTSNYLDNLERLGLVEFPTMVRIKNEDSYKEIEDHEQIKEIVDNLKKGEGHTVEIEKIKIDITDLGKQFVRACVLDKSKMTPVKID